MPRDSAGNYTLPPGYLAVTGQTVLASQHNPPLEDLASAMTASLPRDGRAPLLGNLPMNGYKATGAANGTDPQDYVTKAQLDAAVAAVSGFFPGFMQVDTATSSAAPAGWLYANGQTVSRTTFAALWARVSTGNNLAATEGAKTHGQYGPGDGSTTFSLPNLYADGGYFIRPISSGRGIGTVQADELKSHSHTGQTSSDGEHQHGYAAAATSGAFSAPGGTYGVLVAAASATAFAGLHLHSLSINAAGGTETRPKNIAYPVLIKT